MGISAISTIAISIAVVATTQTPDVAGLNFSASYVDDSECPDSRVTKVSEFSRYGAKRKMTVEEPKKEKKAKKSHYYLM